MCSILKCAGKRWLPAAGSIHSAAAEGSTEESSTPFLHWRPERPAQGCGSHTHTPTHVAGFLGCTLPIINNKTSFFLFCASSCDVDLSLTFAVSDRTKPGSINETAKYKSTDRTTSRKKSAGSSSSPRSSHRRRSTHKTNLYIKHQFTMPSMFLTSFSHKDNVLF